MEFSDYDLEAALEAIDKIRAHKNRPDLPRIARYLYRSYNFSSEKTIKILEHLLGRNRVKEVVYKGNISYRNPLNWKWKRNFDFDPKPDMTQDANALKQIYSDNMNASNNGVSESELDKMIEEECDSKEPLEEAKRMIKKDEELERTVMNDQGSYILSLKEKQDAILEIESSEEESECDKSVDTPMETESTNESSISQDAEIQPVEQQRHRKGDRISRNKKTKYDPSEYFFPPLIRKKKDKPPPSKVPRKRGRPLKSVKKKLNDLCKLSSSGVGVAKVAAKESKAIVGQQKSDTLKSDPSKLLANLPFIIVKDIKIKQPESRVKGCFRCNEPVDLTKFASLSCEECTNIVHEKCVWSERNGNFSAKWYCSECKSKSPTRCCVCDQDSSMTPVLMCDMCEEIYHPDCHQPKVKLPLSNKQWTCSNCPVAPLNDVKYTLVGASADLKSSEGTHAFKLEDVKQETVKTVDETEKVTQTEEKGVGVCEEELPPEQTVPSKEGEENDCLPCVEDIPEVNIDLVKGTISISRKNQVSNKQETLSEKDTPVTQPSTTPQPPSPPPIDIKQEKNVEDSKLTSTKIEFGRHQPGDPIPQVDSWSATQVCDYFTDRLGPDVGLAFLSQDIDGKGLKLMSRADVTESLGLKLGESLKVLYHIKKIQLKTNELRFLWL